MDFQDLQNRCFEIAKARGFHDEDIVHDVWNDPNRMGGLLMLIVTELAEAMEAVRHDDLENFKEEMADITIRIMDTCELLGIDLLACILAKCEINEKRPHKHGGKRV